MHECTKCGRKAATEGKSCFYCGGEVRSNGEDALLSCCRCHAPMVKVQTAEAVIDQCPRCGGGWYDRGELEAWLETHKTDLLPTSGAAFSRAQVGSTVLTDTNATYLKCPRCQAIMTRKNYGRVSGVIVDICGAHGLFLDGHELQQIRDFVATGGDRVTQERQRVEARHQKRRAMVDRSLGRLAAPYGYDDMIAEVFWDD